MGCQAVWAAADNVRARVGAGRFAPSPSGDLHLGNLRTALIAWLAARSSGRRFLLRVDDLDAARNAGTAQAQISDLLALGLDFDGEIVWQSQRAADYERALTQLSAQGKTYECYCSRKDILAAPTAPHAPPGAYPGTCRNLSARERAAARARLGARAPAIRLRTAEPHREHIFTDMLLGTVRAQVDDFVLRRGDGVFAYNLVTVVDDAASGVDQVVRGDDLAASTPRQVYLAEQLGVQVPTYAHVPLLLNRDGKRLAKRDGAVTLAQLRTAGFTAEQVLQYLAQTLGLSQPGERVTTQLLLSRFVLSQLPREATVYVA